MCDEWEIQELPEVFLSDHLPSMLSQKLRNCA